MPRRPKVERVIADYGLDGWGERLETDWTAGEASLRDLADQLNRAILRAALREAGGDPAPGAVDGYYRALTSDEATAGERTTAEAALREEGVDVEALEADFVTHQAVHTYLRNYRDAAAPSDDRDPIEAARERLDRLESRHRAVLADTVESLADAGEIDITDPSAIVSASVVCDECGAQFDVGTLLERGGCECDVS